MQDLPKAWLFSVLKICFQKYVVRPIARIFVGGAYMCLKNWDPNKLFWNDKLFKFRRHKGSTDEPSFENENV